MRRSFDEAETRASGLQCGLHMRICAILFASSLAKILALISIRVLEIPLLFKNFKVVLKHFESLYMNGSNFSSSQHKV